VAKSESSAISYFRGIINEFDNISAHDKRSQHVAAAFLEMARFYKSGSPEANIAVNPAQAFSFLHHAASYFGDPAAQFELAKLMMDGDGVTKNTRVAAQWLLSASRKGYAPAQALLGNILWHGGDGVKRAAGDGLGLLAIARRNALGEDKVWVNRMYETARSEALPIEIMEANAFIVQESAASHLALTNDMLINGTSQEGASVAARALKASPGGPRAPEAISGTSKALTELGAAPLGLPQSALDPEPSAGAKAATAGIIQMYRLRFPDAHIDIPIRYAGVSN
jgi:hypothetical protein